MPLFLIERNFAERLEITPEIAGAVGAVNVDCGVNWSHSYQTADGKKTYCLYDSPNAESIQNAATTAGIPADVIVEVSELRPENYVEG
ncbi:MAG: DUF4242 domain-containing protein [Dehalococcoidia bacterium]|jgi:hypothetical protein|nr:DUF4242 domain-containing protein [Dehalococcoidia bacterium]